MDPKFNLEVLINKEDIFWFNITREMVIGKAEIVSKFNLLSRQYNWKYFRDIYDTIMKISYDYVIMKIKQALVSDQGQLIESPSLTEEKACENNTIETQETDIVKENASID